MMPEPLKNLITVTSETGFVPHQSEPDDNRYVFFYTITIHNESEVACQLLSRHWIIQDSNKKIEEIFGEGVIGEQPLIQPGEKYQYTSGAVLETEIGTMEGRYFMVGKSDQKAANEFEINIPRFTLSVPRTLH
ncbi:MAG: Co2+/Mg2+ efflux protein ApaG [Arenicella sp.]|nr:Co2+/Mg2+ efflux protein ApaG [Arenicella sp.]